MWPFVSPSTLSNGLTTQPPIIPRHKGSEALTFTSKLKGNSRMNQRTPEPCCRIALVTGSGVASAAAVTPSW